MPNLTNMVDKRGSFKRGKRFGWQTAKAMFDNLFLLRDAIRNMFDADGYPNTREINRISATYELNDLDQLAVTGSGDRTGRLPATLTKLGVGSYVLTFVTPLPSGSYDLHLTTGWGCDPVRVPMMHGYGNKSETSVELAFSSWNGVDAIAPCDPLFLTIAIGWDG